MVTKRCHCPDFDRCRAHPWHIWVKTTRGHATKPERGPVTNYMHLLPPGAQVPTTRNEAKTLEKLVLAWVIQGKPAPTMSTTMTGEHPLTIAEAATKYATDHLTRLADGGPNEHSILRHLVHELGTRSITALTDHKLARRYLRAVEERTSESRANRYLARWSHFLNWCRHEFKLTGDSPFFHKTLRPAGVEKGEEPESRHRRLQTWEDEALLTTFRAWPDDGMMLGRYYCALDALLRQGEMLKLDRKFLLVEKVHGARKYILKLDKKTTKSGKGRDIPVESDRLTEWLDSRVAVLGRVFGQKDGSWLTAAQFRTEWENARVKAGIYQGERKHIDGTKRGNAWVYTVDGDLHWHDLRHEGASTLLEQGVNLDRIRRILGHTSLKTTQRYLNPPADGLRESLRQVAEALGR